MNVLVLNCGSSSLKYKIVKMPEGKELVRGEAERVGVKSRGISKITHSVMGKKRSLETPLEDHPAALKEALNLIADDAATNKNIRFDLFAHRYVHPGTFFPGPVKVSAAVLSKLKKTFPLAPIHNPISYRLIEFCYRKYPSVRQFAVFDTSFHRTIPPEFAAYALDRKVAAKYGIRKIGFHGISHRYVMEESCRFLSRDLFQQKIISCHLGTGGASVCAIRNGKSINNSMGFTPLEGLMMNTRSGDIDPGAVFYMMFKEKLSSEEAEKVLNNKSGVLGVFNSSSDLRDAMKDMGGDRRAKITFDMYVRRVRTYVCFYALILKKADILIFTDSLGVGFPELRRSVCVDMGLVGINIDEEKNRKYREGIGDISSHEGGTRILVVPTDEEIMIAREAYKELMKSGLDS
ncbi:MAG: acetate/propionate family kinase [Candidatus Omnitrophica bacterium]|nr:acetate/propionate family kinase [Candidatus Omnitrophota bacterium]MDD4013039.1 acetate/propionate family kinase [Candidatus Omnitrophota bacterium]